MSAATKKRMLIKHPAFHDGTLDANQPCILEIEGESKPRKCIDYYEASNGMIAYSKEQKGAKVFGVVTRPDGSCPIGVDGNGEFHGDNGGDADDDAWEDDLPARSKPGKAAKAQSVTFRLEPDVIAQIEGLAELAERHTGIAVNKSWALRECLKIALPILTKKFTT